MSEIKVGDRIKDNDPRRVYERVLEVTALLPFGVLAEDRKGVEFEIATKRIFTDRKPRRTGFSLVHQETEASCEDRKDLRLVVIRGFPGSGKSTMARTSYPGFLHYEPDHFFSDTQGCYRFDAQIWDMACEWTWTLADLALARKESVVVSDVFPKLADLEPYRLLAEARGARFEVVTLYGTHGNTHRVPVVVLRRMAREFEYEPCGCHAGKDGECTWPGCPQNRDGEPAATGRHCPLDTDGGDNEDR